MRAQIAYLKYVLRHKWFVFKACLRLGVPLHLAIVHDWTKFTPSEWGAYVRNFFNPDGTRRSRNDYQSDTDKLAFLRAWQHHESSNKHHWGYWLTFEVPAKERYYIQAHGDGYPLVLWDAKEQTHFIDEVADDTTAFVGGKNVIYNLLKQVAERLNRESLMIALPIPEVYAREMVADWVGAGMAITGNPDPSEWYEKNKDKIVLHDKTRLFVECLIRGLTQREPNRCNVAAHGDTGK